MFEPSSRSDTIDVPGASRLTCLPEADRLVNGASVSSEVAVVPLLALAPTLMIHSSVDGLVIRPALLPSLPTAATTTMPACHTFSTANWSGSVQAGALPPDPYDRLTTRIGLAGSSLRCFTTQSRAAIIWVTSTAPVAVPI